MLVDSFIALAGILAQILLWQRIRGSARKETEDHVSGACLFYCVIIPAVFLALMIALLGEGNIFRGIALWALLSAVTIELVTVGSPWKLDEWFSLFLDKRHLLSHGEDRKEYLETSAEQQKYRRYFWRWAVCFPFFGSCQ